MSEIFEGYERQYCELSTNLARKCSSLAAFDGEKRKQKLLELKNGLDEGESLIRKMDVEARGLLPAQKASLLAKLTEYKSDLNHLKREVKKSETVQDALASRDELLEAGLGDSISTSADQRDRMLISTDRLNKSGQVIKESKRVLLETEEIGVSILQGLHDQRETLLHSGNSLHGVDDNIGKSRRILNSMTKRMSRNKWIIIGIIAALVTAILLIIYVKWSAHK